MKLKVNKQSQIGLMVVLALLAFIWGYNFLKGRNILKPSNVYYITYNEVSGIMGSDPVVIRGLKVGQVTDIGFDVENPEDIVIRILIDKGLRIPKDSKAVLGSMDLLGSKAIKLKIGNSKSFYASGDTLVGQIEVDMLNKFSEELGPVKDKGVDIVERVDSIAIKVNKLINEDAQKDLHETMANLNQMTAELALLIEANRKGISASIDNLNLMMATVAAERENISALIENMKNFSEDLSNAELDHTMQKLDETMTSLSDISARLNNEEGTLQLLMKDPELYQNLTSATENANLLLEDLRKHPNRYVQFSLVNRSKSTYMNDEGVMQKLSDEKDLTYMLVVKKTLNAVSIDDKVFVNPSIINEFQYKGTYYYYTGEYKRYDAILEAMDQVEANYPDASILVLKKGKPIPIEDVLK